MPESAGSEKRIQTEKHRELLVNGHTAEIQVKLWLRVENNNKYVHGKTATRLLIEEQLLQPYQMQKPCVSSWEYILTLLYPSDEVLDSLIHTLLYEAESLADRHNCFIEADVFALDDESCHW